MVNFFVNLHESLPSSRQSLQPSRENAQILWKRNLLNLSMDRTIWIRVQSWSVFGSKQYLAGKSCSTNMYICKVFPSLLHNFVFKKVFCFLFTVLQCFLERFLWLFTKPRLAVFCLSGGFMCTFNSVPVTPVSFLSLRYSLFLVFGKCKYHALKSPLPSSPDTVSLNSPMLVFCHQKQRTFHEKRTLIYCKFYILNIRFWEV